MSKGNTHRRKRDQFEATIGIGWKITVEDISRNFTRCLVIVDHKPDIEEYKRGYRRISSQIIQACVGKKAGARSAYRNGQGMLVRIRILKAKPADYIKTSA